MSYIRKVDVGGGGGSWIIPRLLSFHGLVYRWLTLGSHGHRPHLHPVLTQGAGVAAPGCQAVADDAPRDPFLLTHL